MILEAGMLLCWMTTIPHDPNGPDFQFGGAEHCGEIHHDVFHELGGGAWAGTAKLNCADGSFPKIIRQHSDIAGLYDVKCNGGIEPVRSTVGGK